MCENTSAENNLQLDVSFTKEDYVQFNLYHQKHSASYKRTFNYGRRSLPFLSASILFLLFISGADRQFVKFMLIFCTIVSAIWMVKFKQLSEKDYIKNIEKLYESGDAPCSLYSKLTFTEHTIIEETEGKRLEIKYEKLQKLAANANCLYLYYESYIIFLIPDCSFEDDEHKQQFVAMIEEKTGMKFG